MQSKTMHHSINGPASGVKPCFARNQGARLIEEMLVLQMKIELSITPLEILFVLEHENRIRIGGTDHEGFNRVEKQYQPFAIRDYDTPRRRLRPF